MSKREILYRGKAVEGNQWIYGIPAYDDVNDSWGIIVSLSRDVKCNCQSMKEDAYLLSGVTVDRDTIGQYTGLTDKNGKEMYEGDIVKIGRETHQILWKQGDCAFVFYDPTDKQAYPFDYLEDFRVEVVGNIHDNKITDYD